MKRIVPVLALCLVLAGCASAPKPTVPSVGQCWSASGKQAAKWHAWEGSPTRPCAASHQLLTYAVPHFRSNLKSWSTKKGDVNATVAQLATSACDRSWDKTFPKLAPAATRLTWFWFLPSQKEWAGGARWVRCDVAEQAIGSSVDTWTLTPVANSLSALKHVIRNDETSFFLCLNSPNRDQFEGPFDIKEWKYADCDNAPEWESYYVFYLDGNEHASYPESTIETDARTGCESKLPDDASTGAALSYPSAKTWGNGSRSVRCWYRVADLEGGIIP